MSRSILPTLAFFGLSVTAGADGITHLGAPVRDLVTLELRGDVRGGCGEEKLEFFQALQDGGSASTAFRVPDGRALVVTDVDWHYFSGAPNGVVVLAMLIENLTDPAQRRRAAESTATLGPHGVGGASEHMTTGFVVGPQARICLDVVNGSIGSPMRLSKVLLRGYLVDEQ